MATEKSDEAILAAQNGAGGTKKTSNPNKRKVMLAERDRFVRTLMILYTGKSIDKKALIFRL